MLSGIDNVRGILFKWTYVCTGPAHQRGRFWRGQLQEGDNFGLEMEFRRG